MEQPTEEVLNPAAERCPDCGSRKIGVSEIAGGGANRFALICSSCRWTVGAAASVEKAYEDNAAWLIRWDNGYRSRTPGKKVDETIKMVSGELSPPNVGAITLQAVAKLYNGESRDIGAPFRPQEEADRYVKGEPVSKQYVCEGCHHTQQGVEVTGPTGRAQDGYFAMPAGWFLQHPSARLFCSMLCVNTDKLKD